MSYTIDFHYDMKNTRVQGMFRSRFSETYTSFEKALIQYIAVTTPFIHSLWSLEAAHATASDVFIFWMAIGAFLDDAFNKPAEIGISLTLASEIRMIYNRRYKEFFASDLYFTAFTLDPRKCFITC